MFYGILWGGSSFEEDSFHIQIEADLCEDLKPETTTPRATITPHHLRSDALFETKCLFSHMITILMRRPRRVTDQ
jgi:hypothetical protein